MAVMGIQPLGCLPRVSALTSYPKCSVTANSIANFHNQMLEKSLQKLNKDSKDSVFVKLDIYSAFMAAMKKQEHHPGAHYTSCYKLQKLVCTRISIK